MNSDLQNSIVLITSLDPNNRKFGTGFVIYKKEDCFYVISCAHVVNDVGGPMQVRVGDSPAKVLACGLENGLADLAVLEFQTKGDFSPLRLEDSGKTGSAFIALGFQLFDKQYLLRPLRGTLGEQVVFQTRGRTERIKAWDIKIEGDYHLKPGYSGSPVVDEKSGNIIGVISHRQGEGERGLAISVKELTILWPEMPPDLKPVIPKDIEKTREKEAKKFPLKEEKEEEILSVKYEKEFNKIRFRKNIIALLVVLVMFFLLWIRALDFFTLDTKIESYIISFGDLFAKKKFNEQIAIVAIEEENFDRTGRKKYAMLVERLSHAGAKVITFDMFFEGTSNYDQVFADSIKEAKNRGTDIVIGIRDFIGNEPRICEKLKKAVSGFGTLCIGEKLGYVRKVPLLIIKEDEASIYSLSLKALELYQDGKIFQIGEHIGGRKIILGAGNAIQSKEIKFSSQIEIKWLQKGCPLIQKGDNVANIYIDLSSIELLRDPERRYVYSEIINQKNPAELSHFKNKLVLVGLQNKLDIFDVYWGFQREERYGVELHADVLNTVLNGIYIHPLVLWGQLLFLALFGILGIFIKHRMSQFSPILRIGSIFLILFLCLLITIFFYSQFRILLNSAYYLGAFFLAYWLAGKTQKRKS